MSALSDAQWILACGLGCLWLGWQIVTVARLPRALRPGDQPSAEPGTPEAFGLFWLDQYSYLGLTLTIVGAGLVLWSLM